VPGVGVAREPVVNSVFATLPREALGALQEWCYFYLWDAATTEVRWMAAWDTTPDDVEAFARGVAVAVEPPV